MEAPPLERKLVAILAADIQGYSRLMSIAEEDTLATLSAHRAITDAIIAQHGGRICSTAGDSILAEFASVFAAVQCAVEIQRDLAQANLALGEERRMWFRIGINIGDVMVKDGDIFGDGVNIAVRLEGLAEPGGICISRGVHDHVRRKLPYGFEDLGEQQSVELLFWESIKGSTRIADYEAYLRQYPEGSFVALARTRLGEFASAAGGMRDPNDREVELSFWESVRESDNPASLQAYLEKYPDGEFKSLAEIRLSELRVPPISS
jgi:adenylate cyclase